MVMTVPQTMAMTGPAAAACWLVLLAAGPAPTSSCATPYLCLGTHDCNAANGAPFRRASTHEVRM